MNKQLIEKVIKSNNTHLCPEITLNNPLLNRNVADAVAKSFVKMLAVSQQETKLNNNIRHSVLANIRKLCKIEPENHVEIGDSFTDSLSEVYIKKISVEHSRNQEDVEKFVERSLNEFLIRQSKDEDIGKLHQSCMNPEVLQALINLNRNNSHLTSILKDVLNWNSSDKQTLHLIKDLWTNSSCKNNSVIIGDMSIKNKADIEIILLDTCFRLLTDINIKIEELFNQRNVVDLITKCSVSGECFQICFRILNCLFVRTNFNSDILDFITGFINSIKVKCMISSLYPVYLKHIVVLLDFDLDYIPKQFKDKYIKEIQGQLKKLHTTSELDLIMLLSHYPQWFDIYFNNHT